MDCLHRTFPNAGIQFDYANVGIPIDLGGSAPNPDLVARFSQIGSVWGNTYQRSQKNEYFTLLLPSDILVLDL
ncbi:MAG: hypothetical protein IPL98_13860 [Saprospiraceae bacterium]|nr:hypothetical protein [Saprospiraceae bacterium]